MHVDRRDFYLFDSVSAVHPENDDTGHVYFHL